MNYLEIMELVEGCLAFYLAFQPLELGSLSCGLLRGTMSIRRFSWPPSSADVSTHHLAVDSSTEGNGCDTEGGGPEGVPVHSVSLAPQVGHPWDLELLCDLQ